jgi:hypothetical protein
MHNSGPEGLIRSRTAPIAHLLEAAAADLLACYAFPAEH